MKSNSQTTKSGLRCETQGVGQKSRKDTSVFFPLTEDKYYNKYNKELFHKLTILNALNGLKQDVKRLGNPLTISELNLLIDKWFKVK